MNICKPAGNSCPVGQGCAAGDRAIPARLGWASDGMIETN